MEVRTDKYEFNHGHKPRGIGAWWFEAFIVGGNNVQIQIQGPKSYGDAKREAIKKGRELGALFLEALS
jgi:hypothetical protein